MILSEEICFLLVLLGTSSASTCWLTFVCLYGWLTLHVFGPSAAFRFQVRVCAGLSCIANIALVFINCIHLYFKGILTMGSTGIWRNTWFNSDLTVMSPNQSQLPHNRLQKFACSWGLAGITLILGLLFRSGAEHCDLALAVEVRQGTLWSWACRSGPAGTLRSSACSWGPVGYVLILGYCSGPAGKSAI